MISTNRKQKKLKVLKTQ